MKVRMLTPRQSRNWHSWVAWRPVFADRYDQRFLVFGQQVMRRRVGWFRHEYSLEVKPNA